MKVSIKRWLTEPYCDCRQHRTTVTIIHPTVTLAVTLCGRFNRKEAIDRTYNHLLRENRWSSSFLRELYEV